MRTADLPETTVRAHRAPALQPTPHLILGPYYPVQQPGRAGGTLWRGGLADNRRTACPVELSGTVFDSSGAAMAGVLIEAWQADELGRYRHPSAPEPAPDDAGCNGYAALRTDSDGAYSFRTLKPGAYGSAERRRAPHVHFQVTGTHDRLVTQMFFPNEPLNAHDHWYRATRRPEQLVASIIDDGTDVLRLRWDIVLCAG